MNNIIPDVQIEYSDADREATSFMLDIIYTAMDKFNISFDRLIEILKETGYYELLNDTETLLVGANYGMEPVLKNIEERLK